MKIYEMPEMELMFIEEDIVTASGGDNYKEDGFDVSAPPAFE